MKTIYLVVEGNKKAHNMPLEQQVFLDAGFSQATFKKYQSVADWNEIREVRESLLVDAGNLVDTALDNGIDATPFRQYRQALRDIPQTYDNPEDVVWPTKPSLPLVSA